MTLVMAAWLQLEIWLWNHLSGSPLWVDTYNGLRPDIARASEEGWRVERFPWDGWDAPGCIPLALDMMDE